MVDFSTIGRRVATQAVNNGLQKVAGNLPGLLGFGQNGRGDSSDTNVLNQPKVDTKMFQFPIDVTAEPGMGNQGHYIMFYINEQLDAQLSFAGEPKSGQTTMQEEQERRSIPEYLKEAKLKSDGNIENQIKENQKQLDDMNQRIDDSFDSYGSYISEKKDLQNSINNIKEGSRVISLKRRPTRRLDTCIAMYMPAALNVTYGSDYQDQAISPLASGAVDTVQNFLETKSVQSAFEAGKAKLTDDIKRRTLLATLGLVDALGISGAREAFEIAAGEVITDRMELAFKNVRRRQFVYNFKMLPKNSREADEIRNIIKMFQVNMLPEMKRGRQLTTMNFPNTFDIRYMYNGSDNDYIHRVSTCVLTDMTVTYGGDRFKTFTPHNTQGAPVVETSMNLTFKELELITRERALEGY